MIKIKTIFKKDLITPKFLPKKIWLISILLIMLLFLYSTVNTYNAYQQPTSSTNIQKILTYSGKSDFDYIISLIENTVYNKTELQPGEGVIFKQIVNNITGNHEFDFSINKTSSITITYSLYAIIETDLWMKTFTLIPNMKNNFSGMDAIITKTFPIDYKFYDTILTTINEEIGINAPNPILIIRAMITVSAKNSDYSIYENYSPEITMSLNQKTIEFSEFLSTQQSGSKTKTIINEHPEVNNARINWSILSFVLGILGMIYLLFTRVQQVSGSAIEKKVQKIKKKYGEWIIEIEENQLKNNPNQRIIHIKTMEDLYKISEDLGKPILSFHENNTYMYFINDDTILYTFILSM